MDNQNNSKEVVVQQTKPQKIKKKHYWWRYLIVFFCGIIFTIGATLGTIYFVTISQTASSLMGMFGINASEYLTEKYQKKTVFEIVMDFATGKVNFSSISGINEITPYVSKMLESVNETIYQNIGFKFDLQDLYAQDFGALGDYIFKTFKEDMTIASLLKVNENSNKILQYLAYEQNDDGTSNYEKPRNLNSLLENSQSLIDNATIGNLVDVGTEGILFNLRDKKIMELATTFETIKINELLTIKDTDPKALQFIGNYTLGNISTAFNDATLNDVIDVGTEGILFNLKAFKINELGAKVKTLKLNQIIDISPTDFPALVYLGNYTVDGMNTALEGAELGQLIKITEADTILWPLRNKKINAIDSAIRDLELGSVIKITDASPSILKALEHVKINDLETKITTLALKDILGFTTEAETSKILWALRSSTINTLGTDIDTLQLGQMVDTSTSKILQALSTSTLSTIGDSINKLNLGDVINIDANSPTILQLLATKNINNLGSEIDKLTIGEILGDSSSSKILQSLSGETIKTLPGKIKNLTLDDVMVIDATSPLVLQSLKTTKIEDFGTAIMSLPLSKIIPGVDDPNASLILKALKNSTINSLSSDIDNLKIGDVVDTTGNTFLKAIPANTKISELGSALEDMKFVDVFNEQIYEADGVTLKNTWKYLLLTDISNSADVTYKNYKVATDMNILLTNMQNNMKNATMFQLQSDNFLNLTDTTILNKQIGGKLIGDMTISEFISKVSVFVS